MAQRRSDHNPLGFVLEPTTARYLGLFQFDPLAVARAGLLRRRDPSQGIRVQASLAEGRRDQGRVVFRGCKGAIDQRYHLGMEVRRSYRPGVTVA